MYRPTVRYADIYKSYVDDLFHAATLDRNQIIRLALFAAAHSQEFQSILSNYKNGDVPLPSPPWPLSDHGLWLGKRVKEGKGGKDVRANSSRSGKTETDYGDIERVGHQENEQNRRQGQGRNREIYRSANGGITIRVKPAH